MIVASKEGETGTVYERGRRYRRLWLWSRFLVNNLLHLPKGGALVRGEKPIKKSSGRASGRSIVTYRTEAWYTDSLLLPLSVGARNTCGEITKVQIGGSTERMHVGRSGGGVAGGGPTRKSGTPRGSELLRLEGIGTIGAGVGRRAGSTATAKGGRGRQTRGEVIAPSHRRTTASAGSEAMVNNVLRGTRGDCCSSLRTNGNLCGPKTGIVVGGGRKGRWAGVTKERTQPDHRPRRSLQPE